ncbi:SPOR domain-containing protein [Pseudoalteromonas sp. SMS1]|uniref:SPOR domain-containing protein n=1 Tax=Pseudoalteromonas sp. SMS1 TaxID=2908894 RepID=UPI001F2482FE|nr:AAA family ATPase [Pseudoalteromonas sp. SMS1]MCF2858881.1 SPOR domain-containing protein [Pseudoalteromonas sp. SMS1]
MQSQILPSRAALVDRIAMQFEYGQSLICLVGHSGLGKSYLAESFITDKYEDFSKAFIQLSAQSKDVDIIRQLMEHTFRSPVVDQKLSLSENFFVLHGEQPAEPCLWVLDGARHLSDELVAELQILAIKAPSTLYILLTAQSAGMLPGALDIHLEPLTFSESKQLLKMFFKALPPEDDPIFSTFVAEAHGNPSVLLDWQKESQSLDLRAKPTVKSKQKHYFIAAFSVILTLCLVAVLYNKQLLNMFEQRQSVAKPSTSVLSEPTVLVAEQVLSNKESNEVGRESQTAAVSKEEPANAESGQVSAVLGALLTPLETANHIKPGIENAEPQRIDLPEEDETMASKETAEAVVPIPEQPQSFTHQAHTEVSELTLPSIESGNNNAWFMSRPNTEWTIQLLAVTDRKVVDEFITAHPRDNLKVAEVTRNGKTWWFVTLAPFEQLDDAKNARANLPIELLAAKPFFKQISQIKQQIQQSQ